MTLLLLRHGESEGNAAGVLQGWLDYGLTSLGERQAEAAGRRLATLDATALYTSPLARALATAERVAPHCGLGIVEEPDLREYDFGEAAGLTWAAARDRWGLRRRDWGTGGIPGEEGMPAFRSRVGSRIEALAREHEADTAICVLHGGVIGAFVSSLFGLEATQYAAVHTANGSITAVGYERGRPVILGLNDCCHLDAER